MNQQILASCWNCSRALTRPDLARENYCPGCGKSTRVCRNCRWFAPGRPNDCREPMVESIQDKEKANYCELFTPSLEAGTNSGDSPEADLRSAAEDLFK